MNIIAIASMSWSLSRRMRFFTSSSYLTSNFLTSGGIQGFELVLSHATTVHCVIFILFSNNNTYILDKVTEKNTNASRGGISARVATSSRMHIDKDVLPDPL